MFNDTGHYIVSDISGLPSESSIIEDQAPCNPFKTNSSPKDIRDSGPSPKRNFGDAGTGE
jgi:hypothetical protein